MDGTYIHAGISAVHRPHTMLVVDSSIEYIQSAGILEFCGVCSGKLFIPLKLYMSLQHMMIVYV